MPMNPIMHALGLHLYQPYGNLQKLLSENAEELRRILLCYERVGRFAHKYAGVAHIHLALSTVLLEQLQDPALINACNEMADIPAILESLRSAPNIEFIGTGFRHAPLALIPKEDWAEQLQLERELMSATFGRVMKGYWPPSSHFSAEVIPALVKAGYEYLLLPSHMLALQNNGDADPYRPYQITHNGSSITVIPIDGGFSQSQQYGLEAAWFADEVRNGASLALPYPAPYLLTTWSDGENGEWFRGYEEQGFFGSFFSPYMEFCETGAFPTQPVSISEYLKKHPAQTEATLKAEYQSNPAFPGDPSVARKLSMVVTHFWSLANTTPGVKTVQVDALMKARALLLRAEESGLLLGSTADNATVLDLITQAEKLLTSKTQNTAIKKAPPDKQVPIATPKGLAVEKKKPAIDSVKKTARPEQKLITQAPSPLPANAKTGKKVEVASASPTVKTTGKKVAPPKPPAVTKPTGTPPAQKGGASKK